MNKPIIHIVSREEFPVRNSKNAYGVKIGNDIYIRKDSKDIEAIKQHELYHYRHKHTGRPTRGVNAYIKNELNADLYARKITGQRQHIKPQLIAIANMVQEKYDLNMSVVLQKMNVQLNQKKIPKEWRQDFKEILERQHFSLTPVKMKKSSWSDIQIFKG